MATPTALHLYISGRVQGVGYRQATYTKAKELGIKGWVRNLHDGRVEAMLEGPVELQEQMLAWCYQGPSFANVTDIEIFPESLNTPSDSFSIR